MAEVPQVDLVGVGLNATDTLIPLPAYPERGSKIEYNTVAGARHESEHGVRVFE